MNTNGQVGAVMVVGGWFDAEDLFGPLATYAAIEEQNPGVSNRIIMGPWSHGQWGYDDGDNLGNVHWGSNTTDRYRAAELEFFNYHLKGEGELSLPEAQMFDTSSSDNPRLMSFSSALSRQAWMVSG